jgi:cell division protein FtsI/penicillin-binding protein 2
MALHEDRRRISIRLSVLQYGLIVMFTALAVSFWVLQVVQHAKFKGMAFSTSSASPSASCCGFMPAAN